MNCVDCADIDPIEDQGELKLRPAQLRWLLPSEMPVMKFIRQARPVSFHIIVRKSC